MSRIEFCHDSPRFSVAHRCVGGYSHVSQLCMCASPLKPYIDARLFFFLFCFFSGNQKTPLSHDGGYFHSRAVVVQLLCGLPFSNRVRAGMTFVSKSRLAVLYLCGLGQSEYLTNTL